MQRGQNSWIKKLLFAFWCTFGVLLKHQRELPSYPQKNLSWNINVHRFGSASQLQASSNATKAVPKTSHPFWSPASETGTETLDWIGKMVGKLLGWGPLSNKPHIHLILCPFTCSFLLCWAVLTFLCDAWKELKSLLSDCDVMMPEEIQKIYAGRVESTSVYIQTLLVFMSHNLSKPANLNGLSTKFRTIVVVHNSVCRCCFMRHFHDVNNHAFLVSIGISWYNFCSLWPLQYVENFLSSWNVVA